MKEMTSVATTMMSEEEKAEVEKELNESVGTPAAATPIASGPASPRHSTTVPASFEPRPSTTVPPSGPLNGSSPHHGVVVSSAQGSEKEQEAVGSSGKSASGSSKEGRDNGNKKRGKPTAEQKKKLQELEEERRKHMEERVETLTKKLIDRLRPFVEAQNPGAKDDSETKAFEARMKREADDLKLESFGVEVRVSAPIYRLLLSICFQSRSCCTRLAMST